MAAIDGRLQVRSYEKDGQKRYTTEVIANEIHFLTSKSKEINESDMDGFTDLGEVSELPF
jgi:single-strand DNA-binding protein